MCGSRLTTPRGRELFKTMQAHNLQQLSTGQPTYWPTDRNKIPDVIDFCVTKGIASNYLKAESSTDLSSDHSPIIITVASKIIIKPKPPTLFNNKTDWIMYRQYINTHVNLRAPLKNNNDIDEAVEHINKCIQDAAYEATPTIPEGKRTDCPIIIKEKIEEKRKLRQIWQRTRSLDDKKRLNRATKKLTKLLSKLKNQAIQTYLENLSPTKATDYSLWKATKKLKQPQQHNPPIRAANLQWARSNEEKAEVFAKHLEDVFKPYSSTTINSDEEIQSYLDAPLQMDLPIKKFSESEVKNTIRTNINIKKAPGYDLVN